MCKVTEKDLFLYWYIIIQESISDELISPINFIYSVYIHDFKRIFRDKFDVLPTIDYKIWVELKFKVPLYYYKVDFQDAHNRSESTVYSMAREKRTGALQSYMKSYEYNDKYEIVSTPAPDLEVFVDSSMSLYSELFDNDKSLAWKEANKKELIGIASLLNELNPPKYLEIFRAFVDTYLESKQYRKPKGVRRKQCEIVIDKLLNNPDYQLTEDDHNVISNGNFKPFKSEWVKTYRSRFAEVFEVLRRDCRMQFSDFYCILDTPEHNILKKWINNSFEDWFSKNTSIASDWKLKVIGQIYIIEEK